MQTGGGVQKVAEPMLPLDYYLPGAYPPGARPEINPKYRETPDPVGFGTPTGNNPMELVSMPGSKYGAGFRQPGDMGRYVAFNDPGQPGAGFANAAAYEAAQRGQTTPPAAQTQPDTIKEATIQRMYQPGVPVGGVVQAATTAYDPAQYVDPRAGMIGQQQAIPTAYATATQATPQAEKEAAQVTAVQAAPAVDAAVETVQAAQAVPDDPRAQITAAQQATSSVGNLQEAQGNAILIDNPVQRDLQAGELISGAAADATKAAQFTEQVEAAQATPSQQATVQGQLAQLTANFDAKNPPAAGQRVPYVVLHNRWPLVV